ncbi:MAG: hypothetical protein WCC31_00665 [Terracidiphilus sp.]
MNAQADQPFAVQVRLLHSNFGGCRNAGDDGKRRLNEEDAALNLRYGELNPKSMVRVVLGKLTEKIPSSLTAGAGSVSKIFPLDSFCDLTGIQRGKVVNIDHFSRNERNFMENERN